MAAYTAPLRDMRFVLDEVVGLADIAALPGCEAATPDLVHAILEQAGRLAGEVIAPLNQPGDRQRSRLENGAVLTPDGFRQAYARFVEGGWNGVPFDPDKSWDERKEIWKISKEIVRTTAITETARGNKDGRWTTVVACAVMLP